MTTVAVVLGLMFFAFCMGFVVLHSVRTDRLLLLDWAVLGMGGVYGLGWALVVSVTNGGGNPFWAEWVVPFGRYYALHTAAAVTLVGGTCLGWSLSHRLSTNIVEKQPLPSNSRVGRLKLALWGLLLAAIAMQWLYTLAYGGFLGLLSYSLAIRSAVFPVQNSLSFLKPFGGLALFASFGFFGLWLSRHRTLGNAIGFLLSFCFSLYVLASWLGRVSFGLYFATLILAVFLTHRWRPVAMLFGGSVLLIAIALGAYYVSVSLNLKSADSLTSFMAQEFSFPFVSFFAQLDSGQHLFRAFKDVIVAPIYLLPSSLWTKWLVGVSQVNTEVIMGVPKGVQGVTQGVPVDLITLGLMQASLSGVAVIGAVFGAALGVIQRFVDRISDDGVRATLIAYVALKIAVLGVFYAQPSLVVSGNFALLVSVGFVVAIMKMPRFWSRTLKS